MPSFAKTQPNQCHSSHSSIQLISSALRMNISEVTFLGINATVLSSSVHSVEGFWIWETCLDTVATRSHLQQIQYDVYIGNYSTVYVRMQMQKVPHTYLYAETDKNYQDNCIIYKFIYFKYPFVAIREVFCSPRLHLFDYNKKGYCVILQFKLTVFYVNIC